MKKRIILIIIDFLCKTKLLKPIQVARLKYYYKFRRWPDFEHPKDLNEKINWMKFYGDTSKWADLSDKYKVREFVTAKGFENILVKLHGKWDNPKDIDWDTLPSQFVMKANNGCGDVLICKDKSKLDKKSVASDFCKLLSKRYGDVSGEPHYADIRPCVIAEELLDINKQPIKTSSLIDYKIWCLNGNPYMFYCIWNRTKQSIDVAIYDLDWHYHPEGSVFSSHYLEGGDVLPKPENFQLMLDVAKSLAEGFPIVRVDLYEVDGKVYFGELTFTSLGGFMDYLTPELLLAMGEEVVL